MNAYVAKHVEQGSVPTTRELFQSYEVNKVEMSEIKKWLSKGYTDLKTNPLISITYGLAFAVVGFLLSMIADANPVFVGSTTTGFLLVGPFLALGLYFVSSKIEKGEQVSFSQSLGAISQNMRCIGIYAITLGFVMSVWVRISTLVASLSINDVTLTETGNIALFKSLMTMDQGFSLIFGLFAVGLVFATVAFITGVVTLPMLMDDKVDIVTAVSTSIRVVKRNPSVMAVWAITIAVIIGFGIATNFIGLLVLMPLISFASWHAYRDLVGNELG